MTDKPILLSAPMVRAWDMNPWIVAIPFAVQRRNIDTTGKAAP